MLAVDFPGYEIISSDIDRKKNLFILRKQDKEYVAKVFNNIERLPPYCGQDEYQCLESYQAELSIYLDPKFRHLVPELVEYIPITEEDFIDRSVIKYYYLIFEKYDGSIDELFDTNEDNIELLTKMSKSICDISYQLNILGVRHGDFSLDNIIYRFDSHGDLEIKIIDFTSHIRYQYIDSHWQIEHIRWEPSEHDAFNPYVDLLSMEHSLLEYGILLDIPQTDRLRYQDLLSSSLDLNN